MTRKHKLTDPFHIPEQNVLFTNASTLTKPAKQAKISHNYKLSNTAKDLVMLSVLGSCDLREQDRTFADIRHGVKWNIRYLALCTTFDYTVKQ